MKIWIIVHDSYECCNEFVDAFSTPELANKECDRLNGRSKQGQGYSVNEIEVQ